MSSRMSRLHRCCGNPAAMGGVVSPLMTDLAFAYRMHEFSGDRSDSTAGAHTLTDNVVGGLGVESDTGHVGTAESASFNQGGNSNYLDRAATTWGISDAWTVSLWFAGSGTLFQLGDNAATPTPSLVKIQSTLILLSSAAGAYTKFYQNITPAGGYNHYVVTWDGSAVAVWVNGTDVTSGLTKTIDGAGAMANDSRRMIVGAGRNATITEQSIVDVECLFGWSRKLTNGEIASLYNSGSGLDYPFDGSIPAATKPQVVCDGNSLTFGFLASDASKAYPIVMQKDEIGGRSAWKVTNFGVSGQGIAEMLSDAVSQVDALYGSARSKNIVVCWEGTNSANDPGIPLATIYANTTTYVQGRQAAGYKVLILTCLPATGATIDPGFEARRASYNTWVLANSAGADAVLDVASDTRLDDSEDATYFNADKTHLTDAGYAVVADLVGAAVLLL